MLALLLLGFSNCMFMLNTRSRSYSGVMLFPLVAQLDFVEQKNQLSGTAWAI